METQQKQHGYKETEDRLIRVLNNGRDKRTKQDFKECVLNLRDFYGVEVSTRWLRSRIKGHDRRAKTKRINYLIRGSGLTTKRRIRAYKEMTLQKYEAEIKEFRTIPNKPVYPENHGITEQEQELLNTLENNGAFLKSDLVFDGLDERQNLRESINKGGAVEVAKVTKQTIGKEFIARFSEVLFFVTD